MRRQSLRSAAVPWTKRGNQTSGAEIVRPSERWAVSDSSLTLIEIAVTTEVSVKELIPGIQKVVLVSRNDFFEIVQFVGGKSLAASEPNRVQPELCLGFVMLNMDMWRF